MGSSTTHRQVVYRLLPETRTNWRWLERTLEAQRQLYNAALEERIDCWRKAGRGVTYMDQCKSLTECRRDLDDMASCPVNIQRGTLLRLDAAYKQFFRQGGFPRFKGRRRWNSFAVAEGVKVEGAWLRLPSFGRLRLRRRGGNPHQAGKPKTAVLKRELGKWYAVVCYEVETPERADDGKVLGLDMNAGQLATSEGVIHRRPDVKRLEARKRRYQRMVSRRQGGSRRRERARARLAKTARRIACKRRDWQHRTSRRVADRAYTVVVEDLNTRAMTASAKGTIDEPGSRVRQKAGLNRVVLDTGWSGLRQMLDYKAGRLVAVNPAYTSQTCSSCGRVSDASRISRDRFHCEACGFAEHADLNAATNIRRRGLAHLHEEGVPVTDPVNRENTRRKAA